jgi:hypothetical protein
MEMKIKMKLCGSQSEHRTSKAVVFLVLVLVSLMPGFASAGETNTPASFALMGGESELAPVWNDPEFQRRLVGSYGFASEAEPKMQPAELETYRKSVVPALTNSDPK